VVYLDDRGGLHAAVTNCRAAARGNLEVDMLTVHQLAKSFALTTLFSDVTFSINSGDRVGLVGPNGCGKTTLLRIIAGEERADAGRVTRDPELRLGYLPQGFELEATETVGGLVGRAAGDVAALEAELLGLSQQLTRRPDDAALHGRYDDLLERISTAETGRAAKIMAGLGLEDVPEDTPIGRLSGGQKTRLNLGLVLLGDPQLLLLDEPTNHLDIEMLEWLEEWLVAFPGGALIVSHDRTFLDRTVGRILAMDPEQRAVKEYAGNYSDYLEQTRREREKQWAEYKDQQLEIRRVKEDIIRAREQAAHTERQASSVRIGGEKMKLKGYKDYQRSIAKKVAKKSKARQRKLERYVESEERVERPGRVRDLHLDFGHTAHLGDSVLALEELSVGYNANAPLLSGLQLSVSPSARIVLTGPNGSGKTTLLRTIAGQLPPLAGRVEQGPSVRLGYMTQEQDGLDPELTPLQTVQYAFDSETTARNFLALFLFTGDEPLRPNSQLSYGQRARLALAQMVVAGCNVLLLDEPINHLDISSRTQFEEALRSFAGAVLAVIHDRYFIERFAAEIWWVEDRGIRRTLHR
jgi:ATP-binding cassette subfamily F protein 3